MYSYTVIVWSDSTVAPSWIKRDPNRWKTFVFNRTTEILQYTTPAQWRLCSGTDNPADHLTRGVRIVLSDLRSTVWILKGSQAIKQVLHKCLPCRLSKAKCGKQIEAPLPSDRVVPSAPFTTTVIDFAGPVYIRC
ncbi:integrase catalytic domain-containing protein [Nephila pilipes]|uniref:Integrase catalytic domain-containing protein n=1 Tax=Nephila pilipes TaxID=299642 RepID=A0A8X6NCQ3_NEPPI|nr:integrase catalytic domain-containing protein [Nephila pilipes]